MSDTESWEQLYAKATKDMKTCPNCKEERFIRQLHVSPKEWAGALCGWCIPPDRRKARAASGRP